MIKLKQTTKGAQSRIVAVPPLVVALIKSIIGLTSTSVNGNITGSINKSAKGTANMNDKIKKITDKKSRAKFAYTLRQTIGQAVLAAGTIAWIAGNLDKLTSEYAFGIGAAVVLLVLYFTNKR